MMKVNIRHRKYIKNESTLHLKFQYHQCNNQSKSCEVFQEIESRKMEVKNQCKHLKSQPLTNENLPGFRRYSLAPSIDAANFIVLKYRYGKTYVFIINVRCFVMPFYPYLVFMQFPIGNIDGSDTTNIQNQDVGKWHIIQNFYLIINETNSIRAIYICFNKIRGIMPMS